MAGKTHVIFHNHNADSPIQNLRLGGYLFDSPRKVLENRLIRFISDTSSHKHLWKIPPELSIRKIGKRLKKIAQSEIQKPISSSALDNLVKASGRTILRSKAVFPFDFFPDELVVDETKVCAYSKYFFFSQQVKCMEFKDIFNITIDEGLLFAKLQITDRYFQHDLISLDYLKKKEAIMARDIIQGLIITKKENISLKDLSVPEIRIKLEKIGKTK